jgi:hypothetical protein
LNSALHTCYAGVRPFELQPQPKAKHYLKWELISDSWQNFLWESPGDLKDWSQQAKEEGPSGDWADKEWGQEMGRSHSGSHGPHAFEGCQLYQLLSFPSTFLPYSVFACAQFCTNLILVPVTLTGASPWPHRRRSSRPQATVLGCTGCRCRG